MRKFNYRQLTTILAGLRHLQSEIKENGVESVINQYPHFDDVDPLSLSDIDDLCETMYSGLVCESQSCQKDDQMERLSELECYVRTIAKLDTSDDFEVLGSVMSNDDAVDTVDRLISEARDMVPKEVWKTQMPA